VWFLLSMALTVIGTAFRGLDGDTLPWRDGIY
jgi:hypothetical protein